MYSVLLLLNCVYAASKNFFVVMYKLIAVHKLAMYFSEKTYHFSFVY